MTSILHHIDFCRYLTGEDAAIGIFGWCVFRDGRAVMRVVAACGDRELCAMTPFRREDVAEALGRRDARDSGFQLKLPAVDPAREITVCAEDAAGSRELFFSVRADAIPGRGPIISNYRSMRQRGWGDAVVGPEMQRLSETLISADQPFFSVLLPTFNTPQNLLRECVDSVRGQTFPSWEVCLVDDGSTESSTQHAIDQLANLDPRIRIEHLVDRGGIAHATNRAASFARGEYVVMLDHDDRLLPGALSHMAAAIARFEAIPSKDRPRSTLTGGSHACDLLYSDEEKITSDGEPCWPVLKPAFSPEFFRGVMYIGHLLCVRRGALNDIGGFDPTYDGIQDYELVLRLSEHTRRIIHVPEILYQWRMIPTSTAMDRNIKGDIDTLQQRAVDEHLRRIGRSARARNLGGHRIRIEPPVGFSRPRIVLFASDDAARCEAIAELTGVEIVIADAPPTQSLPSPLNENESDGSETLVAWVGCPIVAASEGWLDHLAFLALDDESGPVSPIIRAPDGRILEAGRALTRDGHTVPMMAGFDSSGDGYHGSLSCSRETDHPSELLWIYRQDRSSRPPGPRYARACASAWVQMSASAVQAAELSKATKTQQEMAGTDGFLNRRFDSRTADYCLGATT